MMAMRAYFHYNVTLYVVDDTVIAAGHGWISINDVGQYHGDIYVQLTGSYLPRLDGYEDHALMLLCIAIFEYLRS